MCEFCNNPFLVNHDSTNPSFAGFFSAAAIDAAVNQATATKRNNPNATPSSTDDLDGEDEDSDGT